MGSDHHLVAATKKKKNLRRRYDVRNLKFEDKRREFQLTLQNPSLGEDGRDVNEDWNNIRDMYIETCEEVLGKWKGTGRSDSRMILGGRLREGDN